MQNNIERFPRLSEAESEIMSIVWGGRQPLTSNHVMGNLTSRTWALSTVMTVLARLCEKGFVNCDRSTRTNYYSAVISEQEYRTRESSEFLRRLHKNSITSMVTTLNDNGEITAEEKEKLRRVLAIQ